MVQGTPIKVTWLDADCTAGWVHYEPVNTTSPEDYLETYGVFMGKDKHFLHVAFALNKSAGDFLGRQRIPRGMIKEIKELTENAIES